MIAWMKKLFGICHHEWQVLDTYPVEKLQPYDGRFQRVGYTYVQQCKHCGKLHNHHVRIPDRPEIS